MVKKVLLFLTIFSLAILTLSVCAKKVTKAKIVCENENKVCVVAAADASALSLIALKEKNDKNLTSNKYEISFFGDFFGVLTQIANNKADIALLPVNMASILYNKTGGKIKILAINSLENFYIVSNGNASIKDIKNLKGKCICILNKDAHLKPVIEVMFLKSGLVPEFDYKIKTLNKENLLEELREKNAEFVVLDELGYSKLTETCSGSSVPAYKKIINLNKEWQNLTGAETLPISCVVARRGFIKNKTVEFKNFLLDYNQNCNYANNNLNGATFLAKDILKLDEQKIKSAIPGCNLVNITGKDLQNVVQNFLKILYEMNPETIGGKIPEENFYYSYGTP